MTLDPRLEPFILVTEIADGKRLADPIFQRKFGTPAPDYGHHILVLYRRDDNCWIPASYANYRRHGEVMLSGGACTDGQVLRSMTEDQQALVRETGGLSLWAMRYGEARLGSRTPGTFGHCGDARAWEVFEQCGYERLDDPHLIVRWHNRPGDNEARRLTEEIRRLGPF